MCTLKNQRTVKTVATCFATKHFRFTRIRNWKTFNSITSVCWLAVCHAILKTKLSKRFQWVLCSSSWADTSSWKIIRYYVRYYFVKWKCHLFLRLRCCWFQSFMDFRLWLWNIFKLGEILLCGVSLNSVMSQRNYSALRHGIESTV